VNENQDAQKPEEDEVLVPGKSWNEINKNQAAACEPQPLNKPSPN
jgi:hypothetical protein